MKKPALLFSIIVLATGVCLAQTTGFTYQGKLAEGGSPANGAYQFECRLFDGVAQGNQVGATQTVVATEWSLYHAPGFWRRGVLAGADRWLEIGVWSEWES